MNLLPTRDVSGWGSNGACRALIPCGAAASHTASPLRPNMSRVVGNGKAMLSGLCHRHYFAIAIASLSMTLLFVVANGTKAAVAPTVAAFEGLASTAQRHRSFRAFWLPSLRSPMESQPLLSKISSNVVRRTRNGE